MSDTTPEPEPNPTLTAAEEATARAYLPMRDLMAARHLLLLEYQTPRWVAVPPSAPKGVVGGRVMGLPIMAADTGGAPWALQTTPPKEDPS